MMCAGCWYKVQGACGGCTFHENGESGVVAFDRAVVTVKGCHNSQHSVAACSATDTAQMKVTSSDSAGDKHGCSADSGAQLTMKEVMVNGTLQSGQLP